MAKYSYYLEPEIYCNINQKLVKKFTLHSAKAYSGPFQTSKQGGYLFGSNYFCKKAPSYMFDKTLNTLLPTEP